MDKGKGQYVPYEVSQCPFDDIENFLFSSPLHPAPPLSPPQEGEISSESSQEYETSSESNDSFANQNLIQDNSTPENDPFAHGVISTPNLPSQNLRQTISAYGTTTSGIGNEMVNLRANETHYSNVGGDSFGSVASFMGPPLNPTPMRISSPNQEIQRLFSHFNYMDGSSSRNESSKCGTTAFGSMISSMTPPPSLAPFFTEGKGRQSLTSPLTNLATEMVGVKRTISPNILEELLAQNDQKRSKMATSSTRMIKLERRNYLAEAQVKLQGLQEAAKVTERLSPAKGSSNFVAHDMNSQVKHHLASAKEGPNLPNLKDLNEKMKGVQDFKETLISPTSSNISPTIPFASSSGDNNLVQQGLGSISVQNLNTGNGTDKRGFPSLSSTREKNHSPVDLMAMQQPQLPNREELNERVKRGIIDLKERLLSAPNPHNSSLIRFASLFTKDNPKNQGLNLKSVQSLDTRTQPNFLPLVVENRVSTDLLGTQQFPQLRSQSDFNSFEPQQQNSPFSLKELDALFNSPSTQVNIHENHSQLHRQNPMPYLATSNSTFGGQQFEQLQVQPQQQSGDFQFWAQYGGQLPSFQVQQPQTQTFPQQNQNQFGQYNQRGTFNRQQQQYNQRGTFNRQQQLQQQQHHHQNQDHDGSPFGKRNFLM